MLYDYLMFLKKAHRVGVAGVPGRSGYRKRCNLSGGDTRPFLYGDGGIRAASRFFLLAVFGCFRRRRCMMSVFYTMLTVI